MRIQTMIFCALGALLLPFAVSGQETVRHTFLMAAKPAGQQVAVTQADGSKKFEFEFNDRGRGPKTTTTVRLGPNGVPVSVDIAGVDYYKAKVSEQYSVTNGLAKWKSDAEQGEKPGASGSFYLSFNGPPEETAMLAAALLRSPIKHLTLLPSGGAGIESIGDVTLTKGGESRTVRGYEISGLGFTPIPIWLDKDGSFFGSVSSWSSVIREGWEASAPTLVKYQDERDGKRAAKLAHDLTQKPSKPVAIINANLFDARTNSVVPNSMVLINGDRITGVGSGMKIPLPSDAQIIDAKGKFLMPGMWDMHVHMSSGDGLMNIANGITSVRDLANDTDMLLAMKKNIEAGEEIGPRILMTGFMDGRGPYAGPTKVFVDTEDEARSAIDNYAKLGYTGIKVYSSIKPELVPKIVQMAHAKGLRVSGHVPAFMNAEQFVGDGVDEIQHVNFLFLNFFFDEVKDTRTPARFTEVAERAAGLDLNSDRVRAFIKLLKDKKIVSDPTLNAFEGMFTDRPGVVSSTFAAVADRMPVQVRRGFLAGGLPVPAGKDDTYRKSLKACLAIVKLLYDSGITLVAGTDSIAGFAYPHELELYAEAGIPPAEVLKIATIGSARVMKRDKELGTIEAGKLADLILIDGDPTKRMSDVRRVSLVIKNGSIYDPAALYRQIGVKP